MRSERPYQNEKHQPQPNVRSQLPISNHKGGNTINYRLFVVADLSSDMIEILGAQFDFDPMFFRGHISGYIWYNPRDSLIELPDLEIVSRDQSFLRIRYAQPRYFRDMRSMTKAREEVGRFNVLRRIDKDRNWEPAADL